MAYETLLLERSDAYAVVTLNRPKVMNALNRTLFSELDDVFTSLAKDPGVRAILLTGAGEKAFAAGADISELAGLSAVDGQQLAQRARQLVFGIDAIFHRGRRRRGRARLGDRRQRAAFMRGVAFDGLNKIGDQILSLLQLHIDVSEGPVGVLP